MLETECFVFILRVSPLRPLLLRTEYERSVQIVHPKNEENLPELSILLPCILSRRIQSWENATLGNAPDGAQAHDLDAVGRARKQRHIICRDLVKTARVYAEGPRQAVLPVLTSGMTNRR